MEASDSKISTAIGGRNVDELMQTLTSQLDRVPRKSFFWAASASVGASLLLQLTGRRDQALFIGQWAPTLLLVGLYFKGVPSAGSMMRESQESMH
jgi:hypothetical protein